MATAAVRPGTIMTDANVSGSKGCTGRDLRDHDHQQSFYAGLARERELEHDLQVYRAYEQAETRLLERGAHIERVVLDHELKSDYQRWLHERDKDHDDYDGHPDRTPDEIREWASQLKSSRAFPCAIR